jgi:hypothetical protein
MDGDHFQGAVSGFQGSRLVMSYLKMTNCMLDVLQAVLQPTANNEEVEVLCAH